MGAETVIKKIEEKALAECEAIRASYAAKAEQIKNNILAEAESKARSIVDNENEKARLMMMRGKQQSTLEKRIRTLDHRHALISGIKAETLARLKNADAASKIALYTKYVENSGISGKVTVLVPESERALYKDGKVLAGWAEKLTGLTGVKTELTLGETSAETDGGVILCGEIYDIDLSIGSIVDEVFANNEKAISDKLFGEGAGV
ncbi:MAG: hypothetical protein ILO64_08100 [Clostridia bacterium]|nr:hypothetical protein [Clostridia bacterium]